jgi:nucleoside phosphorylase
MIVAIGSLQREAIGIIRSGEYEPVDDVPEDFIAYRPISDGSPAIVLSGSGSERAKRATQWAVDYFSPDAIISFGFCGATRDHARSGDIIIAARVMDLPGTPFEWSIVDDTNSLGPDRTMLLAARTAVEVSGLDFYHGTIVTVSKVATTSGTKRWLGDAVNASAVDTEAHAIADVATKSGTPWAAVACVLDDRDFDAPAIVNRIGFGPNERGLIAYLRHVVNTPVDIPALLKLGKSSTRASASLTTFMGAFMDAYTAITVVVDSPESD